MITPQTTRRSRAIELEGSRNFRDIGGIPAVSGHTRFGIAFRSDRLSNLTDTDAETLRELSVKTIIDMRSPDERERAPNRLPAHLPLQQLSRPFLPRHTLGLFEGINSGRFDARQAYDAMLLQYNALALEHTDDYRQIIDDLLAPATPPVILHCTSGKDRTGLIVAILLLAVGVSTDEITADYLMTHDRIEKVDFFGAGADPRAIEVVMAAKSDYIEAAFRAMRGEYGTIDAYISRGIGMTAEKRRRLAELLIEA